MQATTLRAQTALYTNGRYYVHGWKNDRGSYTVVAAKKGQFRRSDVKWIAHQTYATYDEASSAFEYLKAEVDKIIATAATKREGASADRTQAIAAFKASTPNPWKVGDLCHTSWGYDQTNVDAFQVTEVKSRTTIFVRAIGGKVEETGWAQGKFTPVKDQFIGQPIMVVVGFHFYKWNATVSESWAVKGHSLYETKPGQAHHFSSYA
jgi:hypothetical protein